MLTDLSEMVETTVRNSAFGPHISRVWTYEGQCLAVDVSYKGTRFAIDLTPTPDGSVDLDILPRRDQSTFRVVPSGTDKKLIARSVPLDAAPTRVVTEIGAVLAAVDAHVAASKGPAPAPAAAPPTLSETSAPAPALPKTKLKVGVLTLPLTENIGGNLQAYALVETLRGLGHETVFLNRRRDKPGSDADPNQVADGRLIVPRCGMNRDYPNVHFIEKNIAPLSRLFLNSGQMAAYIDRYAFDAVIVGSDQVWRPKYTKGSLLDQYLGFLPDREGGPRRISYAASFGSSDWEYDAEQTAAVVPLAARFDAVSVREDSAVDLARTRLGVDAEHVLDPTLLLDPEQYSPLFAEIETGATADSIVTYMLDVTPDKAAIVDAVSAGLSRSAFSADGQPFGQPPSPEADKSVERWLASFYNARFIVTDSFHGVAFSILFNKPFIAYGNPKRGMARFQSVLKMFGLEDRLIMRAEDMDLDAMLRPIDWAAVNARRDTLRRHSMRFLNTALHGADRTPVAAAASTEVAADANPLNVLCTGCGVCVSESCGSLRMAWTEDGFLEPRATSGPVPAEAVKVCPFNPDPDEAVRDEDALAKIFLTEATDSGPRAGRFIHGYIGYSRRFRPSSSSGGVATYVLEQLLQQNVVDYLFVVQGESEGGYRYRVFDKGDDILKTSRTRYYPVTLEELFEVIAQKPGRVAVSGVACFVKAIRLKQYYHPELREKIPFVVGIICGGLKSRFYTDFLASRAGIDGEYTRPEYRIKNAESSALDYSFTAMDAGATTHSVRMKKVGDMWGTGLFKSRACDFCTDVMTELADISLGDAWLPDYEPDGMGNSVVLTRSALAERLIREGIESGELAMKQVRPELTVRSQGGGFNHKRGGVTFRAWMARYFSDVPMPYLRPRLRTQTPLTEALVQIHRERTRSKSLRIWKETRNAGAFGKRMRRPLQDLKAALAARKDDSTAPLEALLQARGPDAAETAALRRLPIARWLRRRMPGDRAGFGLLRSALRDGAGVRTRDETKS